MPGCQNGVRANDLYDVTHHLPLGRFPRVEIPILVGGCLVVIRAARKAAESLLS